jgi:hypothetical protein
MRRRGCCRDAECQDAAWPERRGALQWNRDVAAALVQASRQSGRQALSGRVPVARLDVASAEAEPAGSPAQLAPLALRALRALRARPTPLALRVRRSPSRQAPRQLPQWASERVPPALPRAPWRRLPPSLLLSS